MSRSFLLEIGGFGAQFAAQIDDKRLTVDMRNASRGAHVIVQVEFSWFSGPYCKICPSGRNMRGT